MADNFFELTSESEREQYSRAAQGYVAPTWMEGAGASLSRGWINNFTYMAKEKATSMTAGLFNSGAQKVVTADEANEIFTPMNPFTDDISMIDAAIRKDRERMMIEQQELIDGSSIGGFASGALTFGGAMADPLMWAASLAAGAGLAVAGARLATYAPAARMLHMASGTAKGRSAFHFGQELLENMAVATALEIPLAESLESIRGEEVTPADHFANIAMGTASGLGFRALGHAFKNKLSKTLNTLDSDMAAKVMQNEFVTSVAESRAPNYEKAATKYLEYVGDFVNNPTMQKKAFKIVGDFNETGTSFYSTNKANYDSISDSNVGLGRTFGSGLHMVDNPAMALGKSLHLEEADIIKFNASDFKLVDLETVAGVDSPIANIIKQVLDSNIKTKGKANRIMKDMDSVSLKTILDRVEKETTSVGDDALDAINTRLHTELGIEGFTFKEDLGGTGGFTIDGGHTTTVGNGIFVFGDVDVRRKHDGNRINFETGPTRREWEDYRKAEQQRADRSAGRVHGENVAKNSPKMIERNARASKGYNREYDITNNNILYEGDVWTSAYVETFSLDSRKMIEPPVKSMDTMVDEYKEFIGDLEQTVKDISATADDAKKAPEQKGLSDALSTMEATMAEIQQKMKDIDTIDEAVKATVSCVRSN